MDAGASNRSGARLGPRQIRTESIMIKKFNVATRKDYFHFITEWLSSYLLPIKNLLYEMKFHCFKKISFCKVNFLIIIMQAKCSTCSLLQRVLIISSPFGDF